MLSAWESPGVAGQLMLPWESLGVGAQMMLAWESLGVSRGSNDVSMGVT